MAKYLQAKNAGLVDEALINFLDYVNELDDFYTTSSCFGRITLLQDVGNKLNDRSIAKWHRKVSSNEVLETLKPVDGTLWFIFEPFILHIVSKTMDKAQSVIELAIASGFKRTGLINVKPERYIVEVLSTERIDAPIMKDGKMIVPEEYISYLIELANEKFLRGEEKIKRFIFGFRKRFPGP
ncbi:MAG: hypothetical protein ABH950_02185 [Candidatus Altiarchaeota archaeon]